MSSSSRSGIRDDDWDSVWQDFDRRRPKQATPVVRPVAASGSLRHRPSVMVLALALTLALAPRPVSMVTTATGERIGAGSMASLVSLSPNEAELPPLFTSVARLAAESADAACWVLQLDPRGPACP